MDNLIIIALAICVFIGGGFAYYYRDKMIKRSDDVISGLIFKAQKEKSIDKKIREYLNIYKEVDTEHNTITPNYKIISIDNLQKEDREFSIFKIQKHSSNKQIESMIITQLPFVLSFINERRILENNFKLAFFDKLSCDLANKINPEYAEKIIEKVQEENRKDEYIIIEKILSDQEKFELFKDEARRKIKNPEQKAPALASMQEFTRFMEELSKGLFRILLVGKYNVKQCIMQASKFVENLHYKGLYCLGKKNIDKLDIVKDEIKKKYPNLEDKDYTYDWVYENGKSDKARTVIFRKSS